MTAVRCALCGLKCAGRFCCTGCAQVYAILESSGALAAGQDFRETEVYRQSLRLGLISRGEQPAPPPPPDGDTREALYQLGGMWCSACGWLIERALARVPGIVSSEVLFASDLLRVTYCPQRVPPDRIVERVASLGYRAAPYTGETDAGAAARRDLLLRAGVAAFLWLNVMTLSLVLYARYFEPVAQSASRYLPFLLLALATPAVFYCGAPILRAAWAGLRHGVLRVEALLALGILAGYGYSAASAFTGGAHSYFDTACALVALVLAGKLVEQGAKSRAAGAVALLYRLMPKKARVLVDGAERFISAEALTPGTVFLVRPGERLAADGVVTAGVSHVDESLLTGEATPRKRGPGDRVVCGSVNGGGVLEVRATHTSEESTLAHIVRAVESALAGRSRIERQVDRAARVFVPTVVAVAGLTFLGCLASGIHAAEALMRAIAVLVVACPCALGIATPLALTAAIGAASQHGILIGRGAALEQARSIQAVVLDKTGTVTEGRFELLETAGDAGDLALAATLEAYSQHPLARAMAHLAESRQVRDVRIHEGLGISGMVDGREVFVGNRRLCPAPPEPALREQAGQWERAGHTVVFYGRGGAVTGACSFGDRPRPGAADLVGALQRRGITVWLVSGDGAAATASTAARIGAAEFRAEALPTDKIGMIRKLQASGLCVGMVGDGVNDGPALAQADLGIALGSGTDVAMQAAPVVIMGGRLEAVLETLDLARTTLRTIRQNLWWAFAYNAIAIVLAAAGVLTPIIAASAMVLSSASVIANSLRRRALPSGKRV